MLLFKKITILFLMISSVFGVSSVQAKEVKAQKLDMFQSLLGKVLPKERIQTNFVKGSVVLSGVVSSVEASDKIERLAQEYYGNNSKILNFMKIRGSQQVMLRLRVGEVKREVLKKFNTENMSFEYLSQKGLIKTIAEPNLVALSGERAEFLAGGEFPVPVIQKDGNISVNYKTYGVKVSFTPLVLSANRIRINVEQELSELSENAKVKVAGYDIPSIEARRSRTTIELAPGESFMIAGLVKDDIQASHNKEKELVVSVAPYLVDPVQSSDIKLPTDNYVPTQLEQNFVNSIAQNKVEDGSEKILLSNPIGFIAE